MLKIKFFLKLQKHKLRKRKIWKEIKKEDRGEEKRNCYPSDFLTLQDTFLVVTENSQKQFDN